ncbi:MAG: MraY family glycosyltransferase [Verrucomicrobiota bacterium]
MSFPLDFYLLAFLGAGLTSCLSVPLWRRWALSTGLMDDPGHRKIHDRPVALAGGLAVLTGMLIPLLVAVVYLAGPASFSGLAGTLNPALADPAKGLLGYGLTRRSAQLAAILIGAVGMVGLGFVDDKYELKPGAKLVGQLVVASLVAVSGVRITLFVPNAVFSYAVTVLWILTLTNACNFLDNMNGLCAGVGAIAAGYFFLSAAAQGQYLVALLAVLTCGALAGFLPFNFPKATVFLGDAGSHLVGYLMAVLAILPHFYTKRHPNTWAVLSPLLILAVPLFDLAWVVVLRWRAGRKIYMGDTNHLSHRLVRRGWTRTQAVLIIWLLCAAAGAVAFF